MVLEGIMLFLDGGTHPGIHGWKDKIFHDSTETTKKMVTLALGVHKCWDDGLFALNPLGVSLDDKVLTAQSLSIRPNEKNRG